MRLTDHAVRFVDICHFLCEQQQLLLWALGEGHTEGDFELLKTDIATEFWESCGVFEGKR